MMATFIGVVATLCACTVHAHTDSTATDTIKTTTAAPVVVSASRWDEQAARVSRQISVVTSRDIRQTNPATAADMIANSGEVYVQKSQAGGGSPRLRGFAANNVLMVVDGVRMNNALYRTGNLQNLIQLDANALESVEVLFGPGSVHYGSDALGGVMVFTTRSPRYSETGFTYNGSTISRLSSATAELTQGIDAELHWKGLASYTSVTVSRFGDVVSGSVMPQSAPSFGLRQWYVGQVNGRDTQLVNPTPTQQRGSGYDQFNVLQKFSLALAPNWDLGVSAMYTTSGDVPRYDRLTEVQRTSAQPPKFAEWYYGPQTLSVNTVSLIGKNVGVFCDDLRASASYQWYEESRHWRNYQAPFRRHQVEQLSMLNVNADLRKHLGDEQHENDLYYGAEASIQDATSTGTSENIVTNAVTRAATRYPDGGSKYNTYALYAQYRHSPIEDLTMSYGVRATMTELHSVVTDSAEFKLPYSAIDISTGSPVISWSIGANWKAMDKVVLRANAATGFRAPNIDDAGKVYETFRGQLVVPNPNLKPLYVQTYEFGADLRALDAVDVSVTGFHSDISNVIQFGPATFNGSDSAMYDGVMSKVVSLQNVGTGWIDGASITARATFGKWIVGGSATYSFGRDNSGAVLMHTVPAFGQLNLTWNAASSLSVTGDARWCAAWTEQNIPPGEYALNVHYPAGGLPAWTIVNVRVNYSPLTGLTLQGAVENIFDVQYRTAGSGISSPGRNTRFTLRTNW